MTGQRWSRRAFLALTLSMAGGLTAWGASDDEEPRTEELRTEPVRIGMASSLFRDTPEPLVRAMMQPFATLMQSQTGLSGKLIPGGDALNLGQQLAEDRLDLAVFHGIEFGWARQRYPELRPLMIAVNQHPHLYAYLVVRGDDSVAEFSDLKGKAFALPKRSREHCYMFLQRRCKAPKEFFSEVANPTNSEDALDDVVDGAVKAAVIDGVALECFKRRKPARFAQLKLLQKSETFPAGVVAYHPGTLDDATLKTFRDGMMNANKTALGRQLMTLWKLTSFEPVPVDYEETLQSIVKAYPLPPAVVPPLVKPVSKTIQR